MIVGCRIIPIEFDGSFEFCLGARPVPIISGKDNAQRGMSLGEGIVYFQSFESCRLRFGHCFPGACMQFIVIPVGIGDSSVGERVVRIFFNRLFEILDSFIQP